MSNCDFCAKTVDEEKSMNINGKKYHLKCGVKKAKELSKQKTRPRDQLPHGLWCDCQSCINRDWDG